MQFFTPPNANYKPPRQDDPDLIKAWDDMNNMPTEGPSGGVRAHADAYPREGLRHSFGALTKVQGVRANVQGYKSFRIPRMSNVWFAN